MSERPILFSGEMVRAILGGRKTQTRRVVKPQPQQAGLDWARWWNEAGEFWMTDKTLQNFRCPYGAPGEHLWVRGTWRVGDWMAGESVSWFDRARQQEAQQHLHYLADEPEQRGAGWKPSIHMPRWASRITLHVTGVRVERLQEITDEDCVAEGADPEIDHAFSAFRSLWDSINAVRGFAWESNPWVWVVEFAKIDDCREQ